MLKKLSSKIENYERNFSLNKAALVIALATLLTKLISLLKVNLFAGRFAATDFADVYFSAFRIPDFIFNLLILGTLSVAFIPVYVQLKVTSPHKATEFANTVLNMSLVVMFLILLLTYIFMPWLIAWLLPGFTVEKFQATLSLSRILLLSTLFFTLSNVFTALLTAHKRFMYASLAPAFYNFGIILGILYFYDIFGYKGLAYGVVLGSVLHMLIQVPELLKTGFAYRPSINILDPKFKEFLKLFFPRILAFDSSSISLIISSIFGSGLATGAIAIYNYAFDIQSVPLGVFALSFSAAAFPALTSAHVKKNDQEFINTLVSTIVKILFYMVPIAIMVLIVREQIVRILLGHGLFGWSETILTFQALGIFALSLVAQALTPVFARSFYARKNTLVPVLVGALSMVVNIIISFWLHASLGVVGLATAFAVSSTLNCVLLLVIFRFFYIQKFTPKSLASDFDNTIFTKVNRIALSALFMGVVAYVMLFVVDGAVSTKRTIGLLVQILISALSAGLVYLFFAKLFEVNEAESLLLKIKNLILKLKSRL